jgi:signal transduction histidine kinase
VDVRLWSDAPGHLQVRISDDGGGVAAEVLCRRGGGLLGMEERARMSGGTLVLSQGPQGLAVNLALQLQRDAPESVADVFNMLEADQGEPHHDSHPVGR